MESGLNFRAVDFLKIGSMVLHDGDFKYISPANQMVILRMGKTDGGVFDWVETMKNLITEIDNF